MAGSVLFIAPSAYPLGGVAVWLDYLVPALAKKGWRALAGLVAGRCHDVAAYRAAYPALPVVEIHNPTGSHEGRIRAIEQTIRHCNPDVVVGVNIVDVFAAAQRFRQHGEPLRLVIALHGLAADLLADIKHRVTVLDAVIATNGLACRLCGELGGMAGERVLYAPCGVDLDGLGALGHAERNGGPLRIAWVGRMEESQKRVADLPGIVAELDRLDVDYCLRIVGDGPDRDSALQVLSPWLKAGRVVYEGALPAGDIGSQVLAKADVLLLTASWETGPIVIWEAMAAGVAVVTSRYVGSGLEAALLHEENCLMFPIGACPEASRQLARLAVDPALCQKLVTGGKALVAARYSIESSVQGWASCLNSIMCLPALPFRETISTPVPRGRLDRLLGVRHAESLRVALGLRYWHTSAGGEWPHTDHGWSATADDEFWTLARRIDGI